VDGPERKTRGNHSTSLQLKHSHIRTHRWLQVQRSIVHIHNSAFQFEKQEEKKGTILKTKTETSRNKSTNKEKIDIKQTNNNNNNSPQKGKMPRLE